MPSMSDTDTKLRAIVESIERLEEDKRVILQQISELLRDAKAFGLDPKVIRKVVSLRKMNPDKRVEMEQLIENYKEALGMLV